jgi:hypothetical protein
MDKWYSLLVLLAVGGGISAIRWWVEKQRREEEAREAAKRPQAPRATRRPPLSPSAVETVARGGVGSRTIFYGRPGEVPARAVDVVELRSSPPEPPPMEEVGALEKHHLERLKAQPVTSIAGRHVHGAMESGGRPSAAEAARPHTPSAARFFAEALRSKNLARVMVLREILGPPKSLEGTDVLPR